MPRSYTDLLYHLVFSTRDRHPWLAPDLRPRLHQYLGGAIRGEGGVALIVNGTADHVHILAKLRQDRAVAEILRAIKANSSAWIHRTFPELQRFAWQSGYGAFTVGRREVEVVRRYIQDQEDHHRRMSFQEEFVALLREHGVEFDERYLCK